MWAPSTVRARRAGLAWGMPRPSVRPVVLPVLSAVLLLAPALAGGAERRPTPLSLLGDRVTAPRFVLAHATYAVHAFAWRASGTPMLAVIGSEAAAPDEADDVRAVGVYVRLGAKATLGAADRRVLEAAARAALAPCLGLRVPDLAGPLDRAARTENGEADAGGGLTAVVTVLPLGGADERVAGVEARLPAGRAPGCAMPTVRR